jgi:hypothetical protein
VISDEIENAQSAYSVCDMILTARSSALAEATTSAAPDPAVAQLADGFVSGTAKGSLTVAVTLSA